MLETAASRHDHEMEQAREAAARQYRQERVQPILDALTEVKRHLGGAVVMSESLQRFWDENRMDIQSQMSREEFDRRTFKIKPKVRMPELVEAMVAAQASCPDRNSLVLLTAVLAGLQARAVEPESFHTEQMISRLEDWLGRYIIGGLDVSGQQQSAG